MSEIQTHSDYEGLEAERWAHRLADGWAATVGAALAQHDKTGEAVLAMAEAGAQPDDIMAGLVMAGLARRVDRLRDRIPFRRSSRGVLYEIAPTDTLPSTDV